MNIAIVCAAVALASAANADTVIRANADWLPFAVAPGVKVGSALDFSKVCGVDAPAGKYGRVVIRDGHFEFERRPGVPQRFYGVNLCFTANFVDYPDAKAFAGRLAHLGYNAIRIHHYERTLTEGSADGTTINPRRMRQLDGLLAACTEAGIYVTTDLFVSRRVPWRTLGQDRDGEVPMDEFKALVRTNEAAYANLATFTRSLLGHVNAYTGRRWADEPALALVSLVNENNIGNHGGVPEGAPRKAAADLERAFYARMERLLHQEIGTKALLTDMNGWQNYDEYRACRKDYDYVDNHFYIDHPKFLEKPWRLPSRCPNANPLKGNPGGAPWAGRIRESGKPFTITEWNYSAPGRYRGVGGIFTGAWAAREGWDGLWRFAWSHGDKGVLHPEACQIGYFDMAGDPLSLASERATMCLFLRGDLATGDAEAMKVDTKEGSLTLVTARTVGGFAERGTIRAGALTAEIRETPATVWASAVDGKPLVESSRILLTHLTDVQNTGIRYADDSLRVLREWGGLPHLMRRGRAEIRLETKGTKVYALRSDGERCGEVPSRRDGKFLVFEADVGRTSGTATYLYEIAVEAGADEELYGTFVDPPSRAKSRVWWHWMNGNVTKEGITADLEAMAKGGIGGATVLDCGISMPAGPVKFNSPEWDAMIRHAADECQRLGLELTLANCSGYSSSGGPWIAASNAMKFVVVSEARLKGGERLREPLPEKRLHEGGFYADIATLAFPLPRAEQEAAKANVTVTNTATNEFLLAADRDYPLYGFALQETHNLWMWTQYAEATIETSADGKSFVSAATVRTTIATEGHNECFEGFKTVALKSPVRGRFFRIRFSFPDKRPDNSIVVTALRPDPRTGLTDINNRTARMRGEVKPVTEEVAEDRRVKLDAIVDVTDRLDRRTGVLDWTAPAGDWAVLRIGYASNGAGPGPASDFGTGLEVDKFDAAAVARHFDAYMGKYARHPAVVATLVDSYEVGSQNWTEGFEEKFREKFGYSIVPYLICVSDRVVGSAVGSDRALRDMRRLCADLFAENYAGTLTRKCHEAGIQFAVEAYGNSPADNSSFVANCDIPMAEFWVQPGNDSVNYDRNTPLDGWRAVSGAAHFWGKPIVDAEAFTANPKVGGRWLKDPFGLKAFGDHMYAAGINRMVYHRWAHQPWVTPARLPGMTMGPWGTHFERTETWWPMVGPWLRYQQRCQCLLQAGSAVADVVYYVGDDAPNSGHPARIIPGLPWDACGREGLAALQVKDGKLVSPGGMTYEALVLPPADKWISEPSAREIARLTRAGASIIAADGTIKREPDFTYTGVKVPVREIHRRYADGTDGYFVAYSDTNAAVVVCSFRQRGRYPQVWDAESGRRWRPRRWRHAGDRTEVTLAFRPCGSYFVMFADREDEKVEVEGEVGEVSAVEVKGPWKLSFPKGWGCPEKPYELTALRSWTELGGETQYFSGIATYETEAEVKGEGGRVVLALGEVKNLAEVTVNGRTLEPLWRPPFEVDITDAVAGTDRVDLVVRVANLWPNRLIGDAKKPMDHAIRTNEWDYGCIAEIPAWVKEGKPSPTGRYTFTTWDHWKADEPLLPSGLLGPVKIRRMK